MKRADVAVLYVDPRGPYPALVADCYDETRDATLYDRDLPVVAHPPCGPWSRLKHLASANMHDTQTYLATVAVSQVQLFGGILEHPAGSALWDYCGLPKPSARADAHGGYTIEVCQCDFGHVARKRTWLYMVGVPREAIVLPPAREPTHWCSGGRTKSSRKGSPVPPGIKVCSAQQRRRTPVAFAEWLIDLASKARPRGVIVAAARSVQGAGA